MKHVKSIVLVLENCEAIPFEEKHIGNFQCLGIRTDITRVAYNAIIRMPMCEELILELRKEADQHYNSLGEESKDTAFDRLRKCPDITSIEVNYEDKTSEKIFVPWDGEGDEINDYQNSFVGENGSLYLMINKTQTIEEMKRAICED